MLVVDAIYHAFKFQKPRFIIGLLLFVGMLLMALFTPYNGVKFIAKDIKCIVFNFLFWAMGVLASCLLIYSMVKPVVGYRISMLVGGSKELVCKELSQVAQKLVSDLGSGATSP